ncbi:hypothetical protein D9M71_567260 [compost metagenome]
MAYSHAFVDDFNPGFLQAWHEFHGLIAGGFDDFHAAFDDRLDVLGVRRWADSREDGHVDAEWLIGHLPAAGNFLGQCLRGWLGQAGQDAQAAGIGNGCGQFSSTDPLHAALDDGIADTQKFCNLRLHGLHLFSGFVVCAIIIIIYTIMS